MTRLRTVLAWLAVCVAAVAVLTIIGWPAGPYRDFDFFPFWVTARLVLAGADPYDANVLRDAFISAGSQGYAFGGAFAYPLPAAILTVPFALLPFGVAAPLWLVTQFALGGLALWALARRVLGRHFGRDAPVLFALVAAMPATLVTIHSGNVSGYLLAITAGAVVLLMAGRPTVAGAVLGVGIFKPHVFLLVVPLLLLRSPDRIRIALGGLASSACLLAIAFAVRPGWLAGWLAAVTSLRSIDVRHANVWGPFPAEGWWLGWLVLAAAFVAVTRWWRSTRPSLPDVAAAGVTLSLAAAPYVWSYYDTMLAVPAAMVMAATPEAGARRSLVLAALALTLVAIPWWLSLDTYRTGEEPFGVVVPLSLLALLLVLRRPGRRVSSGDASGPSHPPRHAHP